MKLIVTAGGQGKKIWPLSREAAPKQFQPIIGRTSLYQQTVETLLKSYRAEDIYISTKKCYLALAREQTPQLLAENYILEPDIAKDRGPGEGYAFVHLSIKHPNEPFMIIQSDVLRVPEDSFLKMISEAEKLQIKERKFISGGVKATYPILGIDYLRLGRLVSTDSGIEIFETDEFIPRVEDYAKTKELIKSFYIATHSNHNCWYPELMLEAYKQFRPDWHEALMKIRDLLIRGSIGEIDQIYAGMEEGATELVTSHIFKQSYTILLPFRWTDIGTWDSIYEFFDPDGAVRADGNILVIDSKRTLAKCTNQEKIVALLGVDNLVVVDTDDALLICDKSRSGEVKNIVETLRERNIKKYL